MKNNFLAQKLIVLVFIVTIITSCKKKEVINLYEPRACFSIRFLQHFLTGKFKDSGDATYIDSSFYFSACYDSLDAYTYNWDFGDGTTSAERDPVHKYSRRGKYQVTLSVSNNSKVTNTAKRNVWVALGDKQLTADSKIDFLPVAIEETANNEFVLLGASNTSPVFYLMRLDSLFKQTAVKIFPPGYSFRSMQPTADGNFILTGTTQGADKTNELIKMKADGTVLWSKVLTSDTRYTHAAQTPDGGYAVMGVKTVNVPNVYQRTVDVTVVDKTDNNGNLQWQKVFDGEYLRNTSDAVVEQDGIVLAGVVRNEISTMCGTCDTLMLTRLDYSGNTVMKSKILWALNTRDFGGTHTTRLANGNYAVYNDTTQAVYSFAPNGQFVDRIFAGGRLFALTNSADGKLLTLQNPGNLSIGKLELDGKALWLNTVSGKYAASSSHYYAFARPVGIRRLRNGGVLAYGVVHLSGGGNNNSHYEVMLMQFNENGLPM